MSFPRFITITYMLGPEAKAKNLLRVDRIHCITEVEVGSTRTVIVHYENPDKTDTETFTILEDLQDIRRQLLHAALCIEDIGCGVPDSLPLPSNFLDKRKPLYSPEPRQGILRTTGIESSPQFT